MRQINFRYKIPTLANTLLAVVSAVLLTLAFPDFELWFLGFVALVPLVIALYTERGSAARSFVAAWVFGTVFFFCTCWWLTFAPITYAGFPPILAYVLLIGVCMVAALFVGLVGAIAAPLFDRLGLKAMAAVPFVWVVGEFLRYWVSGNNWNAIAYSQAFAPEFLSYFVPGGVPAASIGGIYLTGFVVVGANCVVAALVLRRRKGDLAVAGAGAAILIGFAGLQYWLVDVGSERNGEVVAKVVALQPNVPMSGLSYQKWVALRELHVQLAEEALIGLDRSGGEPVTVVFPESPMNFQYAEDVEFQRFVNDFARQHDVNVLFNSAEPDPASNRYFNSAVMVSPEGRAIAQYDKIYLVPFGEFVPSPFQAVMPALVGSFSVGSEYDLVPLGDATGGIMICFESHFGELSREYVRQGADVLIEMTNDGYLGPTPVLRQHLASAVFRSLETNRPMMRVTNVGITAYITERGKVVDPAESYQEDTRVWHVTKSDGSQTIYVRFGDWFAWVCVIVTLGMFGSLMINRRK
ncbi:MAG: apolipoprotein N-acyltransferase [Blastocatellia bacterium]|nr:apolipoprotein N-acyltransferase [Blastocatellia bacterium]